MAAKPMSRSSRPSPADARFAHRPHTSFGHDDDAIVVAPLTYRSVDGHTWDALLARPRRGLESPTVCVVVHGEGGNYLSGMARRLAFELAARGFPTLGINTRMANFGAAYGGGRLAEVPDDIEGAVQKATELRFESVVLVGEGTGATAATHFLAERGSPTVVGLVTLAQTSSLPDDARRRWEQNDADPRFAAVLDAARQVAEGERPDDIVCVARGAAPGDGAAEAEIWTYRTWWECHAPNASHAVSREQIARVDVPVLIVQPDDDLGRSDGEQLARAAGERGRLEVLTGVERGFWDRVPQAAGAAAEWVAEVLPASVPTLPAPPPPSAGTAHQLVTLVAEDGTEHDALLHRDAEAEAARPGGRIAVLHMHGNQGNLTVGTLRFLPNPVVASGAAMLVVQTRLANSSQLVGHALLPDAIADLRAGVDWLLGQGYDRIVLSGYSLGAALAARYAAEAGSWLAGLMTLGGHWSIPESTRSRMEVLGSVPSYDQLIDRCQDAGTGGRPGGPDDPMIVVRRAFGADDLPRHAGIYTARTWWWSRGPEAVDAMTGRHIGSVSAPILLVQGTTDAIADPADAERLADAARAAGNQAVKVAYIDGVGHSFRGGEERVSEAVTGFLRGLG